MFDRSVPSNHNNNDIEYVFSEHARDMLNEREIGEDWLETVLKNPDMEEARPDGTVHLIKAIDENERRYLRVVINRNVEPIRIVTMFFDRRLRRRK